MDNAPQPGAERDLLFSTAAISSTNVWVVREQQATAGPLDGGTFATLIEHWNGHTWSAVPRPAHGDASAALYSVSVDRWGNAWAAGETYGPAGAHAVVEHLDPDSGRCKQVMRHHPPTGLRSGGIAFQDDRAVTSVGTPSVTLNRTGASR